jgi:hypothetical protein
LVFYDQAQAAMRYAQKVAIAQRCNPVQVQITASSIQLSILAASGCVAATTPIALPGTSSSTLPVPSGISISGSPAATVQFNGAGQPTFLNSLNAVIAGPTTVSVTATGEPTRSFVVEQETGYVHPAP